MRQLKEYKENYLMWALNEEIPFSNNVSERSLRNSKTKMKISGQFKNLTSARNYAKIKSYLETRKQYRHSNNSRNENTRCQIKRLVPTSSFSSCLFI